MRRHALFAAFVAACAGPALLFACGPSTPAGPKNPDPAGSSPSSVSSAVEAGPPTTTTTGLTDTDAGTKLPPVATGTGDATDAGTAARGDAGHKPDPGRSSKDIQALVQARRDEARACYDAGLSKAPTMQGDLVIMWTIDPKGNPTNVVLDAQRSQITEPGVVACVVEVIKKIKFSESPRGFQTNTFYPFNFKPKGKPQP